MGGIWIRSQDKKRLKLVDDLLLCNIDNPKVNSENPFDFEYSHTEVNARTCDCESTLGIYKSEERALQVLDEIQRAIIDLKTHEMYPPDVRDGAHWTKVFTVYEMPTE